MSIDPSTLSAPIENLRQILVAKYFFLAAYTILLYDHIVTIPEEIQTVWKKKKTFPLYLFILVRYYAPLAVSVVAFAFFSTLMTRSRCARWMLFLPLGVTMPLTILPGILMLIRVYALYNRNRLILYGLSASLVLQTVAGLWQYTVSGGTPAPDPLDNYEYHFCIYLPPKRIGRLSSMYIFWELGYDSVVFLLTIARTLYMHWRRQSMIRRGGLVNNLVQDGAFYFGCIFSVNLMWALMILHAPTGLRAIAGVYVPIFLFDPLLLKCDPISPVKPILLREHTDGLSNHSQLANSCLRAHYIRTHAARYPDVRLEEPTLTATTFQPRPSRNEGFAGPRPDGLRLHTGSRLYCFAIETAPGTVYQIARERIHCRSILGETVDTANCDYPLFIVSTLIIGAGAYGVHGDGTPGERTLRFKPPPSLTSPADVAMWRLGPDQEYILHRRPLYSSSRRLFRFTLAGV